MPVEPPATAQLGAAASPLALGAAAVDLSVRPLVVGHVPVAEAGDRASLGSVVRARRAAGADVVELDLASVAPAAARRAMADPPGGGPWGVCTAEFAVGEEAARLGATVVRWAPSAAPSVSRSGPSVDLVLVPSGAPAATTDAAVAVEIDQRPAGRRTEGAVPRGGEALTGLRWAALLGEHEVERAALVGRAVAAVRAGARVLLADDVATVRRAVDVLAAVLSARSRP